MNHLKGDRIEIRPFNLPDMEGVINLLTILWGPDKKKHAGYFKWKYQDNPVAKMAPGVVACIKGKIVGFRGYMAYSYLFGEKECGVLAAGDTIVDPSHRMKGISMKMGRFAEEYYESEYELLLNLSSSDKSTPGYKKLGFYPLLDKLNLTQYSMMGLTEFLFGVVFRQMPNNFPIIHQNDPAIEVSTNPDAQYISNLFQKSSKRSDAIRWNKAKEEAITWRFANPLENYSFVYARNGAAFIAVRHSKNRNRGIIVDFEYENESDLKQLVKALQQMRVFSLLSMQNFSSIGHEEVFKKLGFRDRGIIPMIERQRIKICPVFVKAASPDLQTASWEIGGMDVRNIENWDLRSICSDSG